MIKSDRKNKNYSDLPREHGTNTVLSSGGLGSQDDGTRMKQNDKEGARSGLNLRRRGWVMMIIHPGIALGHVRECPHVGNISLLLMHAIPVGTRFELIPPNSRLQKHRICRSRSKLLRYSSHITTLGGTW